MAVKKKKVQPKPPVTLLVHCNNCNHPTTHTVIAEKVERSINTELIGIDWVDFWTDTHVETLKCGSCSEFALKKYNIWCEDGPFYPEYNITIEPKRGSASLKPAQSFKNISENILNLYQEIIVTWVHEANLLCAGGIRAILEAICIDKGIKGGTVPDPPKPGFKESLKGKIYGLYEAGYITIKHAEILTHHQYLGDKALHELKRPSKEELELAIEIIAHTLSSIYELEVKAQELKSKEAQRPAKKSKT